MAAFYTCSDCGNEFIGPDWVPDDVDALPVCWKCQALYNYCIACDSSFIFDSHRGDPTGDLCFSCWDTDFDEGAAFL